MGHPPQEMMYCPNRMNRRCIYQVRTKGNPSREAKLLKLRTTERQLQSCGGIGWAEGTVGKVVTNNPRGRSCYLSVLFRTTISPFQDRSIVPKTFIGAGVTTKSKSFQTRFQTFSN